jgi:hypothetical protein
MRTTAQPTDRLALKSDAHTLAHNLITRYNMSIAEADCLTQELRRKQLEEDPTTLLDGQIFYTAVALQEPAGKPLARCHTRRIRLTLHAPEDLIFRAEHGLYALRRLLVSRLCFEAFQQAALLAQEDLCRLMYLSRATIQRILAEYRRQGDYIPTRGNYHDIGPGLSHKYQAVRLYLRGHQPTAIAMRLCHSLSSIERYLDDFCRVAAILDEDLSPLAISRVTGQSRRLVGQYRALYEEFRADPDYQEALQLLQRRIRGLRAGKKGGQS